MITQPSTFNIDKKKLVYVNQLTCTIKYSKNGQSGFAYFSRKTRILSSNWSSCLPKESNSNKRICPKSAIQDSSDFVNKLSLSGSHSCMHLKGGNRFSDKVTC